MDDNYPGYRKSGRRGNEYAYGPNSSVNRGRSRGRGVARGSNMSSNRFQETRNSRHRFSRDGGAAGITRQSFHSEKNARIKNEISIVDYVPNKQTQGNNNKHRNYPTPYEPQYFEKKTVLKVYEMKTLLKEMLDDDYRDNITLKLLDPKAQFLNFLNNEANQDLEIVKTILKVILKSSKNKMMEQNFRNLLILTLGSQFSKKRLDKLISIELNTDFDFDMFHLIILFLKANFEIIPGIAYDVFYIRVFNLKSIIDSLQLRQNDITPEIIEDFKELYALALASNVPNFGKAAKRKINVYNNLEPPDNYKNISIFPTTQDLIEIHTDEVFLRENKSRGAYQSVDHYLDVQFRLIREDFIQPLREGLSAYKNNDNKKRLNIRVYKNVRLLNSLPTERHGIIYNLLFDKKSFKKIKWAQSKRFLYGSLLCLSSDNFKTLLFGTIANREVRDLENGILSIKFYDSKPSKDEEYILLETTNMFESYRHVLLKLQDTNEENLCMKNYLVYVDTIVNQPGYLARNVGLEYKFKDKNFCAGDINLVWPRHVDLNMDESQFNAFKSALTNEIVIIQGPPGTGKTYLGLNICECLIKNVQAKLLAFGPILIVCYTNHALDQFLEGISQFTDKIVRIGSRCKSEKLEQFSLLNLKKKYPSKEFSRQKWAIFSQMKELKDKLIFKQAALKSCQEKLLTLDKLKIFVDEEQFNYLKMIQLRNWLYGDSFAREQHISGGCVDNVVEWLIYEEIMHNINRIVIDAQTELLKENEENYDDDRDNEVNYINNQRKLDIDDEDINNLNDEFNRVIGSFADPDETFDISNDGFTLVRSKTTKRLFEYRLRSKQKMSHEKAITIKSLDCISIEDRWNLYRYWRSQYTDYLHDSSEELEIKYNLLCDQINEIHFEEDRNVMKDQSIIGMTTTGAARYNKVLSLIRCKIIIVEEAAEVLESHIVGSLNPGCEHLILIGDHKQLKPNPSVFELAKKFELDLSLFERLINNHVPYTTLALQHRMRPEIAEIMTFIYRNLQNHESVLNYPNVPSVGHNLYFIDHYEPEESSDDIMSYSNRFEAEFIVKFCRHLMKNGVDRTRMTILTLYSGQMFLFRKLMDRKIFEGVRVCVVDNYQGEENDIILLSLVRSNEYEKIGFLSIENRICVSLSRAKHGLYVFGNFQMLAHQNEKWKEICQFLKRKGKLSRNLNLLCQNHPDKKLVVVEPLDFDKYPEGGCEELCNHRLNCGHACRKSCHFLDKDHRNNQCLERCTKLCANGHRCNRKCYQDCNDCVIPILKNILNCNHKQLMPCHKTPEANDCRNKCERILLCGHACERECREKCDKCLTKVEKISVDCGHSGDYYCYDEEIKCIKLCNSLLGCEHKCVGTCGGCFMGRLHETCEQRCQTQLICGHACKEKCSLHCPPCRNRCEEGCSHNVCPNNCGEDCVPCYEKCKWKCKHKACAKLCYELCDRTVCNESCDRMIKCTRCNKCFKCYGVCGEPCRKICLKCDPEVKEIFFGTEDEADSKFITLWTCNHSFEINSLDIYMNSVPENQEIIAKKCPKCNTIINKLSCFRYLNIVKKISFDIKSVQNEIYNNLETLESQQYFNKLNRHLAEISSVFTKYKLPNYFESLDKLSKFMLLPYSHCLNLIYEIYLLCFCKNKDAITPYIDKCICNIIIWLNPKKRKFNQFEIDQFNVEFDRIGILLQISEVKRQRHQPPREIEDFINELKNIIFTKEKIKDYKLRWEKYYKESLFLPNMQITDYERQQIVKAIGLGKGRWFKCPQGHFYVIGECGGATQTSICPECQSVIGGENHRLVSDNRFAPEIDDASMPAWPGM